jgi:hypothetical protein
MTGVELSVSGETNVMVTGAQDEDHAHAALKVISTPDALLTLVLGGDHLPEGIETIQAALKTPVLRPHYAYLEAKRVGERFGKRKANLKAAAELIEEATVMSPAEIKKCSKLARAQGGETAPAKSLAATLKKKAGAVKLDDGVK